ncbi:hypothetical protein OH687_16755 [Burkholderia anthina]|nr:hypothetical protein OH687_16755 [Burkholderia anthina]
MYPVCNNPQKMKDQRFRSSGSRIIMRYSAGATPAGAAWTRAGARKRGIPPAVP